MTTARPEAGCQAGYWSWRAHTEIQSSSVMVRPDERMSASSVKYSSRGGPGANRMSIRPARRFRWSLGSPATGPAAGAQDAGKMLDWGFRSARVPSASQTCVAAWPL